MFALRVHSIFGTISLFKQQHMKCNFNSIFILIILVLGIVACQKDSATETLLTQGSWKVESKLAIIQGSTINLNDSIHPCVQDDLTRFLTDGSVEIDDGPLKCHDSDPQTFSLGPWTLSENDTRLFYGGTTYDVEELTESRLRLLGPYSNLAISGVIDITFGK